MSRGLEQEIRAILTGHIGSKKRIDEVTARLLELIRSRVPAAKEVSIGYGEGWNNARVAMLKELGDEGVAL